MKKLRIICACEESQVVTKAFRDLGHEAYSCDILPTSGSRPDWHIQDDVMNVLRHEIISNHDYEWDVVIAFPPCTDLAVSGAKHFAQKQADGRQQKSIAFFEFFTYLKTPHVAIENPIGIMSTLWRKPDQIIQPWMFGHEIQKSTCLWLKNLPLIKPTKIVGKGDMHICPSGKVIPKWYSQHAFYIDDTRQKQRSKTFQGIADAFAKQWSEYLINYYETP